MLIETTTGRVMFNDILHAEDAVLQPSTMRKPRTWRTSSPTATSTSDGARRSTCSTKMKEPRLPRSRPAQGLSFATERPQHAPDKSKASSSEAENEVAQEQQQLFDRGIITGQERYNDVIDTLDARPRSRSRSR